jgi:hypothetical protein
MKKADKNPYGFKNYIEARDKADTEYPANPETLKSLNELKTKEDVRFYVLMNYIRSIDGALNTTLEDAYLRRIQENILYVGEKFLQ